MSRNYEIIPNYCSDSGPVFLGSFYGNLEFSMVLNSSKCLGVEDFKTGYTYDKRATSF